MRAETKRTSPSTSTRSAPTQLCGPAGAAPAPGCSASAPEPAPGRAPGTAAGPCPAAPAAARAPAGAPPASPPAAPPGSPPGRGGGGRRTPPPNAFSAAFLEAARRRQEAVFREPEAASGFAAGGSLDGPFGVEPFAAPHGPAWAVIRRGEPVARGHAPLAVFRDRTAALLAAAVLPAGAAPNRLEVAETPKRLGLPVHDGRRHLGHVAGPFEGRFEGPFEDGDPKERRRRTREWGHRLARDLHAARTLATRPESLVLLAEALDYETLVLFGRALMRRLEAHGPAG